MFDPIWINSRDGAYQRNTKAGDAELVYGLLLQALLAPSWHVMYCTAHSLQQPGCDKHLMPSLINEASGVTSLLLQKPTHMPHVAHPSQQNNVPGTRSLSAAAYLLAMHARCCIRFTEW
jgi:hypothetical protein